MTDAIRTKGDLIIVEDDSIELHPEDFGDHVASLQEENLALFERYTDESYPDYQATCYFGDFDIYPEVETAQRPDGTHYDGLREIRQALRNAEAAYSPIIEIPAEMTYHGPPVIIETPIREDAIIDYIDCPMEIVDIEIYEDPEPVSSPLPPRRPDWSRINDLDASVENAEFIVIPVLDGDSV